MASLSPDDLRAHGIAEAVARGLAGPLNEAMKDADLAAPRGQEAAWSAIRRLLVSNPAWRWDFETHRALFRLAFSRRRREDGPPPAWTPDAEVVDRSNLKSMMENEKIAPNAVGDLHRWSVENREVFWHTMLRTLGIVFRTAPAAVLDASSEPTAPTWLLGASMNIAESCFRTETRPAVLSASEEAPELRWLTYGQLRRLCARVANGLGSLNVKRGERVAIYMPMTPESVAIYLGVILAGRTVVGIADSSAPPEFEKRARIGDVKLVFTIDAYRRGGKDLAIYEKVVRAGGPPSVVLPREGQDRAELRRDGDRQWQDFLGIRTTYDAVPCAPSAVTNVLFSSGTTKDPKAIPWTHVTPIKCAADAHLHHDVHPTDVLAWPTSFGWMMGPWLTYASLVNGASMALYVGDPQQRAFGTFVRDAGVTILGVVPKLVRSWKETKAMEGLDWSRIRLFSSTAEPSSPEEMLYLMFLAGYRPIVEYCGGTEVGGGYLTGTVVQPCAPGTFTTPAMGLDLVILDDGRLADLGEVFLVPPSIGLSNEILNYDNAQEYYAGLPKGPGGELLRRHGDRIERLPGGYYRHHGRVDDVINIHGVKTSAEEIRGAIANESVVDAKPVAVDVDGTGQHVLVVYAVPRDPQALDSTDLRVRLREAFEDAIRERLNPLLAHVHDVVLVPELPQAGPGKTRTMRELQADYLSRFAPR